MLRGILLFQSFFEIPCWECLVIFAVSIFMIINAAIYSRTKRDVKLVMIFFARYILTLIVIEIRTVLPVSTIIYNEFTLDINIGWFILAVIWLPELIAIISWGFFFALFALAATGAALFIDYFYFSNLQLYFGIGPITLVTLVLILVSFRWFANYGISEIIKIADKSKLFKVILTISEASYATIGGALLWRIFKDTGIYEKYIDPLFDKLEKGAAAVQIAIILFAAIIQFPTSPLWLQVILILSVPVGTLAIIILLATRGMTAWKEVFEIYTEEFSSQSISIKAWLDQKKTLKHRKFFLIWALIGNWTTIIVAIIEIGSVVYMLFGDFFVELAIIVILIIKYVFSMIKATKEIYFYLKTLS